MNPTELGKFIANLRNEKHLTQEELAAKLYIDKRKISRWECGTSIPEFEMLIKLSEILDVSLYELSICKRIEKDKVSRKVLNKFNSIKDIKKYNLRKKIMYSLLLLIIIFFIITSIYTFKHYGSIEIYELNSLDNKYRIRGNYIKNNNRHLLYIKKIELTEEGQKNNIPNISNCNYEIYDDDKRVFNLEDSDKNNSNYSINHTYEEIVDKYKINKELIVKINCESKKKKIDSYSFKIELLKIYNSKL